LLEDVLGWVAVLIGAVLMFFLDWPIIDPVLSIGIAIFILVNVVKSLNKVTKLLLQAVPEGIDLDSIRKIIVEFESIKDIHDLHVWSMDGEYIVLTVHLVLEEDKTIESLTNLKKRIREGLKLHGIDHATLEFEMIGEECVFIDC
jgi:cobalt-zinc-cadmium efflux system protein